MCTTEEEEGKPEAWKVQLGNLKQNRVGKNLHILRPDTDLVAIYSPVLRYEMKLKWKGSKY